MGNYRFRLSNILRLPRNDQVPKPQRPAHCVEQQHSSKKALPIQTFDQMLLLSSSSRSFRTERLPLCSETEPALSDDYHKIHTKCCHGGVTLKVKSPRTNAANNKQKTASKSSSSSGRSSSFGSEKKRGLSERSVTVVKSSANPESDFKESMLEMIVENNIANLDGLEELLVSYLVLNSDEFHQVIVSVFKDIVIGLFTNPMKVLEI
ncbi:unnamed protein product [Rhodiola kirilowii]